MIYIALPEEKTRRVSFYLAMEEFVARHIEEDECFFMWQVEPSVVFGRNQLIENEVNLDFCRNHHIQTYRRKSGGGCVYADMSNIMFSYITRDERVSLTFNRYVNLVALTLFKMGIDAKATGRNDILIDGRKVSGNAFYHIPGRSIVHGTMLYDTNMEFMVGAITPTNEKLISKGVQSVRQHITLLKDHTDMSLSDFKRFVKATLCQRERMLTTEDIAHIEDIERQYLSPEFILGNNPRYTIVHKKRIEGVGDLELRLELKNNVIRQANLMGDFFLVGDIDNRLLNPLKNVSLERESIEKAVPERIDDLILNMRRDDFIGLVLGED